VSTRDWSASFPRADVVLVVPPFAATYQPSLACHLLQACARERGFDVTVVYANLLFAAIVGHGAYGRMLEQRLELEHVFKHAAFRSAAAGELHADPEIAKAMGAVESWLSRVGGIVRSIGPTVVGATCSFEQITASVALLNRCKEIDPTITTIVGGANCEGDMAEGMLSLGARIDYVAAGESEETFPRFIEWLGRDGSYPERIIHGAPCTTLDRLPRPDYGEYFDQYARYLAHDEPPSAVPYESSRGCWWGQKHHCTFCGLNGMGIGFRQKAPDVVVDDLTSLLDSYPVTRVNFVDNIMPNGYYTTLLPRLADELPVASTLFYEQKANITFKKALALKAAHVTAIQPGIESLNSHILRCMDKGAKAYQNVALLRYSRLLGLRLSWNLLGGFPGDRPEDYEQTAELLPHIVHLEPPDSFSFVRFDRFSPYFDEPERYGIANIRPKPAYFEIFPEWTDHEKLAYYFDGDYHSGAFECPSVIDHIRELTSSWRQRWTLNPKPALAVVHLVADRYVLVDTRDRRASPRFDLIDAEEAAVLLFGARLDDRAEHDWAIERHLLVELDDRLIPLATARPVVMTELEDRHADYHAPSSQAMEHAA
jgi:ribosomal peptide maturation radical SAM protein 1